LSDAVRRARAASQLLGERVARRPEEIVGRLLAVQAQDLRAARLALRARGSGFGASDVDAAIEDGRLVRTWLLRGTLHLVRGEDWSWLFGLTGDRQRATSVRRLGQLGVTSAQADRAVELAAEVLGAARTCTRPELAERLAGEGIPADAAALRHLIGRSAMDGVLVLGPGETLRTPPPRAEVDEEQALAQLGRRYLAAHVPAEAQDLAAWSGLPLRTVQRALALAGDAEVPDPPARIPPRLLGAFDEYLLGWRDRSFAVPREHARLVHPGGGMIRAVATDDGLVVGPWHAGPAEERADVERFLAA
jgi:hypothetical protein